MGTSPPLIARRSPKEILHLYRLPRSLGEAHEYLFRLSLNLQLLQLYQHFFPDCYARSTAHALISDDEAYSPKEAEFLQHVDEQLFPIFVDFMLYGAGSDERSTVIPLRPVAPNLADDALEYISGPWRLAFFLAGELCADDFAQQHPAIAPPYDSPLTGRCWGDIDWQRFIQNWPGVVAALHPSVAVVPIALEMGVYGTANVFLDSHIEMPMDGFSWDLEDMEYLCQHRAEYETTLAQMEELLAWLNQDRQHIVLLLENMVANLHTRAPEQPQPELFEEEE